jgi:sugar lactone lactonase YvrE
VADGGNNTIRKLTPVGTNWAVTTIAGTANTIGGSADGTNQAASFYYPSGVAVDTNGNVFVADASNNNIREVTPVGTNWVVTTIAGTASASGGSADGTNQAAQFYGPSGLALDGAGNLYVADTSNDTIRKLTPVGTNWVVTTIAGQAQAGGSTDGGGLDARFDLPYGIAADTNGNLYVADTYNHTIRLIAPADTNWVVSTLAGVPGSPGGSDGIIWQALFNYPFGITTDGTGRVFVGDTINGTIRMGLLTPVPDLVISPAVPDGVMVSWPGVDVFTLQTNADLNTINWVNYGAAHVVGNGTNSVTISPAAGQLFFRLSINP